MTYNTYTKGLPFPLGVTLTKNGIHFALNTEENIQKVELHLYTFDSAKKTAFPLKNIFLDPLIHKTGNTWHILVDDIAPPFLYRYLIQNPFYKDFVIDPYAKNVMTTHSWGEIHSSDRDKTCYQPFGVVIDDEFNWEEDQPLKIDSQDLIIYEMHVRGFTKHPSSRVPHPGTYMGIIEKIPHLLELGINAVELMPLHEFNELEYAQSLLKYKRVLYNYWGYSPVQFFAPMNRYATTSELGASSREFKTLVKALHKNGIEVFLDVVFNHTAEGNAFGPVYSYRGLDDQAYYIKNAYGEYANYTGCGNTFNVNHPWCQDLILDCLRYWATEMHVDGFRFDLASIFFRGTEGEPLSFSPLAERISEDPLLANVKLIAEPWDAVGMYQVGSFLTQNTTRWAEWNGKWRDTVRRFIKGDSYVKGEFATRLCGSEDIYNFTNRTPLQSFHFVTTHDGFTLQDLVSYNHKHNEVNGEQNRDGINHNDSWNCGEEGATDDPDILFIREKQKRNFHIAQMLSQGVPTLLMGDEYGHSKKGNNNTWCQDNELNWFLWDELSKNADWLRFYKLLIHFRKHHSLLRKGVFLTEQDITWVGADSLIPDWDVDDRFIGFILRNEQEEIYVAFNASEEDVTVLLPAPTLTKRWKLIAKTDELPPFDIYDEENAPELNKGVIELQKYSSLLLLGL